LPKQKEEKNMMALMGHCNVAYVRPCVRLVIDLRHSSWISCIAGTQYVLYDISRSVHMTDVSE